MLCFWDKEVFVFLGIGINWEGSLFYVLVVNRADSSIKGKLEERLMLIDLNVMRIG